MDLNQRVLLALKNINFCERYKMLSDTYQVGSSHLELDNSKALEIIFSLGYNAIFMKKESFFKIVQNIGLFKFQFNISLRYGNVEFIWDVLKENQRLTPNGPWGVIYKSVLNSNEKPLMPKYHSYDDLKEIFNTALIMFEDFKNEIMK